MGSRITKKRFDPAKNAYYILGILLSCKQKLDTKEASSLRSTLNLVLRHNGNTVQSKEQGFSPWFLHPPTELDMNMYDN